MSQIPRYLKYELPSELIAHKPLDQRDKSRLLVISRKDSTIKHQYFSELPSFISSEDLLVLNNSKVIPALIECKNRIEFLLLEKVDIHRWIVIGKPSKKFAPGLKFEIIPSHPDKLDSNQTPFLRIIDKTEDGKWLVELPPNIPLEYLGKMPLPPYIRKIRKELRQGYADDEVRYQTVIAKKVGSVAAPTAGLHFTPELLSRFNTAFVTLHVGAGTFQPIREGDIENHKMHSETFEIPDDLKTKAKRAKKIVACGTTTLRTLESRPDLEPGRGATDIFITPPYQFQAVDSLITNFHLPESTLLCLVAAFAGEDLIYEAYQKAIEAKYRFYSYGDAMLIL